MVDVLPVLIGFSAYSDASLDPTNPVLFTLPIPSGAMPGDLLIASIVTMCTTPTPPPPGRGLTELYAATDFDVAGWGIGVWAGIWDGDTTPIAWQGSGMNSGIGQFFGAFVASFRDRLDPARPLAMTNGPAVAGLPSLGPSICVNWVRAALGGVGGFLPFEGTDWIPSGTPVSATYLLGTIAIHGGVVPTEAATDTGTAGNTSNSGRYMAFGVLGQHLAPPCRIYPREDSLGVNSGRIWPPPKSQQASPRRAGGYY